MERGAPVHFPETRAAPPAPPDSFVEKNPAPVLRLNREGRVSYANPGARATLVSLGAPAEAFHLLLPEDAAMRLQQLAQSGTEIAYWQYPALGREYETAVFHLADAEIFHAYLRDVTAHREAERRLLYLTRHDPLSGLPNRRYFVEEIDALIARGEPCVVALLGINRLRHIVAGVGHGMADRLLQTVARRLEETLATCTELCTGTRLYRFEGAVYGLLLPCPGEAELPRRLAARLVRSFETPVQVDSQGFFLGISMGASGFPADGNDAITLISHADSALQRAKEGNGEHYRAYDRALSDEARERLALENDLHDALKRDELSLLYQPQVDIVTHRIVGAEVLLRWQHRTLGVVLPSRFIPIAEETGLIVPIGEWVLRAACAQARVWRDAGLLDFSIAVNLSARQFMAPGLAGCIADILAASGLPEQALELEITESLAMEDVTHSIQTMNELKQLGVRIAMDDFGTGYSSLASLRRLPIDKLKVDQSFVRNLEHDAGDATLVRAIVELGHNLGMRVIAEGVESFGQTAFLRGMGCEEAQGFYISPPLDAAALTTMLA